MKLTVYITVDQWSDTMPYSVAYGSHTIGHSVGPLVLTLFIDK